MSKSIKKYSIALLKFIFGFSILYLIYKALNTEENFKNFANIKPQFSLKSVTLIGFVILLQFVNWVIEALKFRYILKKKKVILITDAIKSVYIGNATGFFTPDRLGNFIGRLLYFHQIEKVLITSSTLLGNFSQLIATVTFAFISIILIVMMNFSINIPIINHWAIFIFVATLWTILMILYFVPQLYLKLIYKIKWIRKQQDSINYLQEFSKKESVAILTYAFARYFTFVWQFYLLLNAFGLPLPFLETLIFSGLLYLFTTLIPSPIMGNLGTREYISLILLSAYKQPEIVLIASLSIWIINIAIPSLIGSYLLLKMNHSKN